MSHTAPVQPFAHWHWKTPLTGTVETLSELLQLPPFWHGEEVHAGATSQLAPLQPPVPVQLHRWLTGGPAMSTQAPSFWQGKAWQGGGPSQLSPLQAPEQVHWYSPAERADGVPAHAPPFWHGVESHAAGTTPEQSSPRVVHSATVLGFSSL